MKQLPLFSKLILIATLVVPIRMYAKFSAYSQAVAQHKAELESHQSYTERLTNSASTIIPSTTPTQITESIINNSPNVTVELINGKRLQMARTSYALRATLAPIIKYSLYGAGIGITLASFFAYYWTASPSKLTYNEAKQLREFLAKQETTKSDWNFIKGASSFGMFLATGIAQSVGTIAINYGTSNIAGNLDWYIVNYTAYAQNLSYLKQSLAYYAIFKESIATTAQLLMRDIEKVLGYLEYCKEITFTKKSLTVKAALQNHITFIEQHANTFAQTINNGQPVEQLIASMTLLETDIIHAIKFVGTYS